MKKLRKKLIWGEFGNFNIRSENSYFIKFVMRKYISILSFILKRMTASVFLNEEATNEVLNFRKS